MSLKEEIGIIEEGEEMRDDAELELIREQETRDKIAGLYHRIDVIAEYIDRVIPEKDKNEKEGTNSEYAKGYEDGVKAMSEKMESPPKEKTAEEKEEEGVTGLGRRE